MTLKKWIGFLDNNKLKAVSPQNHKCLYMAKQVRSILPPIFEQVMSFTECQQLIETEIGPFRKQQDNDEINEREEDDNSMNMLAVAAPNKQSFAKAARSGQVSVNTSLNVTQSNSKSRQATSSPNKSILKTTTAVVNAAPATNYRSKRENPIIINLEQTIGCPIQEPLMEYIEQNVMGAKEFSKLYQKRNKAVTKEQMVAFFKACGGLDPNHQIKIG